MRPARTVTAIFLLGLLAAPSARGGLAIALTNDDGWSAAGIQAVQTALTRAGHRVVLAAPAGNQSGSGTALNIAAASVRRETEDQYSVWACRDSLCADPVAASPATSGLLAVDILRRASGGRDPDLLVSGINAGPNLGGAVLISGTVGAALIAANRAVGARVPSIAISGEAPANCAADRDCELRHYAPAAQFLVRLIERLQAEKGRRNAARLLPDGLVLNVNWPSLAPQGVRVASLADSVLVNGRLVDLQLHCEACTSLSVGEKAPVASAISAAAATPPPAGASPAPGTDVAWHLRGYVTITPLSANRETFDHRRWRWLESLPP